MKCVFLGGVVLLAAHAIRHEADQIWEHDPYTIKAVWELTDGLDLPSECRAELRGLTEDLFHKAKHAEEVRRIFAQKRFGLTLGIEDTWITHLCTSDKESMLWAGFWEGGTEGRTTTKALFDFASMVDTQTVHPSTELGNMVANHNDLDSCFGINMPRRF